MRRRINILESLDWTTVIIYLILVVLGWLNIYAAVYNEDIANILDFDYRSGKQFVWILLAFIIAIVILVIEYRFYSFAAYFLYGLSLLLLIGVLLFGKEINGAKSWFVLGGVSLQPSEFTKVATALALARLGSSHFFKISSFKYVVYSFGIILLPVLLILGQSDFGSALIFLSLIFVLYREGFSGFVVFIGYYLILLFVLSLVYSKIVVLSVTIIVSCVLYSVLEKKVKATLLTALSLFGITFVIYAINRWLLNYKFSSFIVLVISTTLVSIYLATIALKGKIRNVSNIYIILIFLFSTIIFNASVQRIYTKLEDRHQKRINIVLGIESDPQGVGYNVNQSKIAIGSGGFKGKGYLQGTQTKLRFVPEQTTDFIFCTVGEEWGFVGSFVVIILFLILLLRLIYLAERQRSVFSRMFGYAVFSVFLFHFAINLGMTIGLMPVIGIPLPFFSYGGSSLWAFTAFLFIFLRLDASRSVYFK